MRPKLTGFSPGSNRRVLGVWVVFVLALVSWALGGYVGAAIAVVGGHRAGVRPVVGPAGVVMGGVMRCVAGARSAGTPQSPWPTTDPGEGCGYKTVLPWWRCSSSVERTKPPR